MYYLLCDSIVINSIMGTLCVYWDWEHFGEKTRGRREEGGGGKEEEEGRKGGRGEVGVRRRREGGVD